MVARARQVVPHKSGVTLMLPKVCQWYEKDWGSTNDCARSLVKFLGAEKQQAVQKAMAGRGGVDVKYLPHNFTCSPLTLIEDPVRGPDGRPVLASPIAPGATASSS